MTMLSAEKNLTPDSYASISSYSNEITTLTQNYLKVEKLQEFANPDWCSTTVSITGWSGGYFDPTAMCGLSYDGEEHEGDFTLPSITSPSCDETSETNALVNWSLRSDMTDDEA